MAERPGLPVELEQMCQAEAVRRMAVSLKQLYRVLGQPQLWDLVVQASWPESPRWHDVKLDPRGEEAIAVWKARVAELLGEGIGDTPAQE